jgi:hypothetical protein
MTGLSNSDLKKFCSTVERIMENDESFQNAAVDRRTYLPARY